MIAGFLERARRFPLSATLLRGSGLAFAIQVLGTGLKYLFQVLAARWMGADEFGVFTYLYNWALLFAVLVGLGLSSAAIRFVPEYVAHQNWDFLRGFVGRSTQIVFWSGGAIAVLCALFLRQMDAQISLPLILLGSLTIPLTGLALHQSQLLRGMKDIFFAFTPTRVVQPLLAILFLFAVWRIFGAPSSLLALTVTALSLLLVAILQNISLHRLLPAQTRSAAPRFESAAWLRVSLPMMVTAISAAFISQMDIAMVGIFLPPAQVGIYAAASKTAALVTFVLLSVNAIVAPLIAELFAQKEFAKLFTLARTATFWMTLPVLALTLFLALAGRFVLGWFGPQFPQAYPALMVLAGGQLVNALTGPVGYLTELTGHQNVSARVYLAAAALALALNFWLVPRLGILGASIGTAAALIFSNLSLYIFVYTKVLHKDLVR
ncbi:MAG: lipopolysaccharide biosynthesis protein [Anaerolineales bacterium]